MLDTALTCPRCARPIPASAPKRLCSACLVASLFEAIDDETSAELLEMPAPAVAHERIGNYELLTQIGRGGMGVVFRARDCRLNRTVAVKLILAGKLASEMEVKRFRTEAEAAANLDHPNIVPIYEVGESEGRHYFAMKLMEGGTLAAKIPPRPGRLSNGTNSTTIDLRHSTLLVSKIARAVHYAHQRGILHRDLKPANILLDGAGEPAVTDFGLARRIAEESDLTLTGTVLGSPAYMAPEQARSAEITTAADIYSLGAVLFHLVTGHPPFVEETAIATMRAVAEQDPPRPSTLNRALDRDLETICLKCLEKEPASRYLSAAALADDLDRWQRREPILARRAGALERGWKWARRHPAPAALIGVSIIALAGFILMQGINEAKLKRERDRAQAQEKIARASEYNTRVNLYAADMFLIGRAIEEGNLALARRTLLAHVPKPGQEDLRGFEWWYFWNKSSGQQQHIIWGVSNTINCLAFSPDGRWLAAGGGPTVVWWNATNHQVHKRMEHDPNSNVRSVCFSPDGSSLWTGDAKGKVRFWLEGIDERVGLISRGTGHIYIAAAAAVADRVAFGERDGTDGKAAGAVALYSVLDTLTRNERGHLLPGSGGLSAFSRDGKWLLTGGGNEAVTLHNLKTGESKRVFHSTGNLELYALAITPDGQRGAFLGDNGYGVVLVDLVAGSPPVLRPVPRSAALAYSPDGEHLALACFNHTVRMLHAKTGLEIRRFDGHAAEVSAVAFSPDGRQLASAGKDQTVRVWDLTAAVSSVSKSSEVVHGTFAPFVFSADGATVTAAITDAFPLKFMRHDLATGTTEAITNFVIEERTYLDLWNPKNSSPLRWFLENGAPHTPWKQFTNFVGKYIARSTSSACSADGTVATIGDRDGKVRLWHLPTATRLPDCRAVHGPIQRIAISADANSIAVAGRSNIVAVWDRALATNRFQLPPRNDPIGDITFSPDDRVIAVTGDDATVELRDAITAELLATLAGHEVSVESIAFSPDGKTLATSAGTITKLWHLPTRREVATRLPSAGRQLTFSPDGSILLSSGGWEGEARLFRGPREQ